MGGAGCRRPSSARLLYPLYGWGTRQHNDDDTNNISNISFNCVTRIAPQREQGTEDWKWKPKLATDASRATVHGPASTNVGSDRGTGLTKSLERGAEVFHDSTFTARGVAAGTEWSLRTGHMLSLGCAAAYFTDCQIQLFISRNRGLRYFFAGAAISSPACQISTENMGSLSAELLINCARRTLHHLQSRSANCAGIFQESQNHGKSIRRRGLHCGQSWRNIPAKDSSSTCATENRFRFKFAFLPKRPAAPKIAPPNAEQQQATSRLSYEKVAHEHSFHFILRRHGLSNLRSKTNRTVWRAHQQTVKSFQRECGVLRAALLCGTFEEGALVAHGVLFCAG